MSRPIRITLALVLLVVLPLAGVVTSGHVHWFAGASAQAGQPSVCACHEPALPHGQDCNADEVAGHGLCPICELAKSLQATGLPAMLVLSAPTPTGSAPPVQDPCTCIVAFIHPTSRSPPVAMTSA